MQLTLSLPLGLAIFGMASPAFAQNDECPGSIALTDGVPIAFDTTAATLSATPWPCGAGGGPDLWYSFTSVTGGSAEIATCGSTFDTVLEVFEGSCGSLVSLECNDDACGLQSTVEIPPSTAGTTYLIRVGGFGGATGTGTIEVNEGAAPATNVSIVSNLPGAFIDISGTGTSLSLTDDGEVDITTTVGNALLPAGQVRVGSNGGVQFLTLGFEGLGFGNGPLPSANAFNGGRSLLPFWDDVDTNSGLEGEIYWQEIGDQLIIQWEEVEFFPGGTGGVDTATFQIQVNASGSPVAQFIYESVDSVRADNGGSATIGFQSEDEGMNNTVEFSFDTAGSVNNGDVLSILDGVAGPGPIGMNYCMANPNSTGSASSISATGSTSVADNMVTLSAEGLPANFLAIFINGQTQGFIVNPSGSEGNLCIDGDFGRYVGPGEVMSTGMTGTISLDLDLTNTPTTLGAVSIAAGETWNFQAWHRDENASGNSTSNLTDGVSITFLP